MSNRPRNNEKQQAKLARRQAQRLAADGNILEAEIQAHLARTCGARAKAWLNRYADGLQAIRPDQRVGQSLYPV